ncbi:MAG TPA: hypothetical protein VLQ93_24210 [Myxococcaceae bacterium]|nr:hypothetical protein [Myxococcaceae bacterium]
MPSKKDVKQSRHPGRGHVLKGTPEAEALRRHGDPPKQGRKTRKQRDIANKRTTARSVSKNPRKKRHSELITPHK